MRDPFQGIGKPEPLKRLGTDIWARRLTQEHRVIYLVERDAIHFLKEGAVSLLMQRSVEDRRMPEAVVKPRWGLCYSRLVYPACAARRRPWAMECYAVGVRALAKQV